MIHPVVVNPVLSPVVRVTDPVRWRAGKLAPDGAILHWDADIDPYAEQTGGVHTFNHAVLSPQYQRNSDGSYTDVGARPAVDVFDGEKWLRSCGAVTNLLPVGWVFSGSHYALTQDGLYVAVEKLTANASMGYGSSQLNATDLYTFRIRMMAGAGVTGSNVTIGFYLGAFVPITVSLDGPGTAVKRTDSHAYDITGLSQTQDTDITVTTVSPFGAINGRVFVYFCGASSTEIGATQKFRNPQLTATPYPVPYVPPGVTQPASNATTTNGCWFSLPDGSELWKALTGQPLTLATRVRMGVGSGELAVGLWQVASVTAVQEAVQHFRYRVIEGFEAVRGHDGRLPALAPSQTTAARNSIMRRITQVNTAGTQFRVGYMIEGTHTAIQWGSWTNYDSSFNPSTLYRLMLGYGNPYPMWFNKITAWKKQVTDAEILEALS